MGKVIVITGGSGGIGQEVAFRFSREYNAVAICYHRNLHSAQQVAEKCREIGASDVFILSLNLEDDNSINETAAAIINKFGKIDVLINAAGILSGELDQVINVNFRGLVRFTRQCLPSVKQSIVNIGSTAGLAGQRKFVVYSATKFAVRGFTQGLSLEYPSLRIYTVNPGLTATKMVGGRGLAPAKVAEIIWQAAEGKYHAASGSDINVKDYLYGEWAKPFLKATRFVKHIIWG